MHEPKIIKFGCWDARMGGRILNLEAGKVLFHRSAGATIPADVEWDHNLKGLLGLADHKGVEQYVILPHSGCLAARTALNNPRQEDISFDHPEYYNMMSIHRCLTTVGANLKEYADLCWAEAKGDEEEATNLMAKRLAIASLSNLMNLKIVDNFSMTVGEAIIERKVNVAVLFVDLKNRCFEYLSLDDRKFHPLDPKTAPDHMCVRRNDCEGCHCGDQVSGIAQSISFFPQRDLKVA